MKIRIDKDIVTFTPEHAAEAAELEALWIKMGNCLGENKSLEPLGVYIPTENKTATFHIAGLNEQEKNVQFQQYNERTHFFGRAASVRPHTAQVRCTQTGRLPSRFSSDCRSHAGGSARSAASKYACCAT